jgi:chromosome partitioning protein
MHDASSKGAINYLNLAKEILLKNTLSKLMEMEKIATDEH